MRILFVENHLLFANAVIEQFLADHEIIVAPTIAEAKEAISQDLDVVLVDYDLPDGKGTEVVRELRALGFRGTVVAISSHEDGNDALRAAGATVTCDFPNITNGEHVLVCVEAETGIVLSRTGQRALGPGNTYRVFSTRRDACEAARAIVAANPSWEAIVLDGAA